MKVQVTKRWSSGRTASSLNRRVMSPAPRRRTVLVQDRVGYLLKPGCNKRRKPVLRPEGSWELVKIEESRVLVYLDYSKEKTAKT